MPFRIMLALFVSLALLAGSAVHAGPVFQLIGSSPLTLPHPSGVGNQSASASFVITSTGGGFLDGTLEFDDGFALPGVGGITPFDASDLARIAFGHQTNAFSGATNILPSFLLEATNGPGGDEIVFAQGQVVGGGTVASPTWSINFLNHSPGDPDPAIRTSVPYQTFAGCCGSGGIWAGLFGIDGGTFVLYDTTLNGVGPQANQTLIVNSQYPGTWRLTAIPEPTAALLFGLGLGGLAVLRRR